MTDTINFDVDLSSEWTAEDSLALDAEILAARGRQDTPSWRYSKWQAKAMRMAVHICAKRGMATPQIAEHLKMSRRHVERILSCEQEAIVWVPPITITETLQTPEKELVQPCTSDGCENLTRPRHALTEHWPGTKARHRRGLCSKCNSALARARRAA